MRCSDSDFSLQRVLGTWDYSVIASLVHTFIDEERTRINLATVTSFVLEMTHIEEHRRKSGGACGI